VNEGVAPLEQTIRATCEGYGAGLVDDYEHHDRFGPRETESS
jgi:hypothetical protein